MTTTLTIIVIIAMLWLAWPRNPKPDPTVGPRPSVMEFDSLPDLLARFGDGDIERMEILPGYPDVIICRVTYRPPPEPPLMLKEEA